MKQIYSYNILGHWLNARPGVSFVDLVACDAVTETEANQVDLNSLKIQGFFCACWPLVDLNMESIR